MDNPKTTLTRSAKMLLDFILGPYRRAILEDTPSICVRNQFDDMEVEISDGRIDGPFPSIAIKVYPNGKKPEAGGDQRQIVWEALGCAWISIGCGTPDCGDREFGKRLLTIAQTPFFSNELAIAFFDRLPKEWSVGQAVRHLREAQYG
jgi:hypothetical protein